MPPTTRRPYPPTRGRSSRRPVAGAYGLVTLLLALLACLTLLVAAASASAAVGHEYLSQISETNPGEPLEAPGAVAVDSEGNTWVADIGKGVVDEYNPTGAFIRSVGAGILGGEGTEIYSIAIAPATRDLYVADSADGVIDVFSPTGTLLERWNGANEPSPTNETPNAVEKGKANYNGFERKEHDARLGVAIDQSTGAVYVAASSYKVIDKFSPTGEYESQILALPPGTISMATSGGDLYVLAPGPSGYFVEKRGPSGEQLWTLGGGVAPPGNFGFEPSGGTPLLDEGVAATIDSGLAVDPADDLYVVNSRHKVVDEFSGAGAYLGQIGGGETPARHLIDPGGIAVGSSGDVYLADFNPIRASLSHGVGGIDVFGPGVEQRTLDVSVTGEPSLKVGQGVDSSVISSPAGIEETWRCKDPQSLLRPPVLAGPCEPSRPNAIFGCEWKCSAQFPPGTKVALSDAPAKGFRFAGWSGGCAGTGSCEVTLSTDAEVVAAFEPLATFQLKVHVLGSGSVTGPAGFECSAECSAEFFEDEHVILEESPASGSEFVKWAGCEAEPSASECEVTLVKVTEVTAEFVKIPQQTLTVNEAGGGGGTVVSEAPGIDCPSTCSHAFDTGTKVTLTAEPNATSGFAGWSGVCSGTATCEVTLNAASEVTAVFEAIPQKTLTVSVTGAGVVRSELPQMGIECGVLCSHEYNEGATVELSAQPTTAGSVFDGWSGGGCDGTGSCVVTLAESTAVTATFGTAAPPVCPNEALRAGQPAAARLPDCRAYEMVSPVEKNDNDAVSLSFYSRAAVSGEAVTYESKGSFERALGAPYNSQYLSHRTPTGWTTRNISPPSSPDENTPIESQWLGMDFTPELSAGMLIDGDPPLTSGAPAGFESLYVGDIADGGYQFVAETQGAPYQFEHSVVGLGGTSADLSHVVFERENKVFEWVDGAVVSISSEPSHAGSGRNIREFDGAWHDVSADGSRVFFTRRESGAGEEGQLFVRENQSPAVEVSASQRTVADPNGSRPALFWGANADGSRVFFTSPAELTNDADTGPADNAGNLYEFNVETGVLSDLTVDHADANGAGVAGVVALSEDGSYVYFVADGVLAPAGAAGKPLAGQPNLYVSHEGVVSFIATLGGGDGSDWAEGLGKNTAALTADGSHLAFQAKESLTGYDNHDLNTGQPEEEVFLYDANSKLLSCVSCRASGERPTGPSNLYSHFSNKGEGYLYKPRSFSDDGSRLFFQSADAVVPSDSNGAWDVYEYEHGFVSLISDGAGDHQSFLQDVSASGNDVFFATADQLVGQDLDNRVDFYDARVDGGFPAPETPLPGCESGELCRPATSSNPAGVFGVVPASATLTGEGNVPPVEPPPTIVKKKPVLTRAQLLAKALKACRRKPRGHARKACEAKARKRYGPARSAGKASIRTKESF